LVEDYLGQIEQLKNELKDKQNMNQEVQQEYEIITKNAAKDHELLLEKVKTIQALKK